MPVTTTPRQIIEAAYATSLKNQPAHIADEPTELLGAFNRLLKAVYSISPDYDPTYFAEIAALTEVGAAPTRSWVEPENAEMIYWLEADYGFSPSEAYMLLGQIAEARCTQMVNPHYSYICKVPRKYLPGS